MAFSKTEFTAGAVLVVIALISITCSALNIYLIHVIRPLTGFMFLLQAMVYCQISYDIGFLFYPGFENPYLRGINLFLTSFGGLSVAIWSNLMSATLLYFIYRFRKIDIFHYSYTFSAVALLPSLFYASIYVATQSFEDIKYVLDSIYNGARLCSIAFNVLAYFIISYELRLIKKSGGEEYPYVNVLSSRMKYYPFCQILSRLVPTVYEFLYGYSHDGNASVTRAVLLTAHAFFLPSAGIGYFIIFMKTHPRALAALRSARFYLLCVYSCWILARLARWLVCCCWFFGRSRYSSVFIDSEDDAVHSSDGYLSKTNLNFSKFVVRYRDVSSSVDNQVYSMKSEAQLGTGALATAAGRSSSIPDSRLPQSNLSSPSKIQSLERRYKHKQQYPESVNAAASMAQFSEENSRVNESSRNSPFGAAPDVEAALRGGDYGDPQLGIGMSAKSSVDSTPRTLLGGGGAGGSSSRPGLSVDVSSNAPQQPAPPSSSQRQVNVVSPLMLTMDDADLEIALENVMIRLYGSNEGGNRISSRVATPVGAAPAILSGTDTNNNSIRQSSDNNSNNNNLMVATHSSPTPTAQVQAWI